MEVLCKSRHVDKAGQGKGSWTGKLLRSLRMQKELLSEVDKLFVAFVSVCDVQTQVVYYNIVIAECNRFVFRGQTKRNGLIPGKLFPPAIDKKRLQVSQTPICWDEPEGCI